MLTPDQVGAYLERIGAPRPETTDEAALRRLQRQHLLSVPFENLSIHWGEPIVLELDRLYDKIVKRRRGGFCYELNGLFHALLRSLGFQARLISACVRDGKGGFGPEFEHMAIIVDFEECAFLVDVGFGDFAREPLQLIVNEDQLIYGSSYRIVRYNATHFRISHSDRGAPVTDDYLFSLLGQDLEDFEAMCHYMQTSPDSHFTQNRICSMATPDGRISLSDDKLTITRMGRKEDFPVEGEEEFGRALKKWFGMKPEKQKNREI